MDFSSFKERYFPLLKEHMAPIILGLLGFSLMGYGLIYSLVTKSDSSEITFQSSGQQTVSEKKSPQKEVLVDVEGAVQKPGIHKLPADARLQDALLAAGGMSEKADQQQVSKNMNLAAKVVDGGKIYIPYQGEAIDQGLAAEKTILGTGSSGVININTASQTEIESLPGIGPVTAQKIIGGRPYASVQELVNKKAVGKSVFEKIKDQISI